MTCFCCNSESVKKGFVQVSECGCIGYCKQCGKCKLHHIGGEHPNTQLITCQYTFEDERIFELFGAAYTDGTTQRVITTGWKGVEILRYALEFAHTHNFLEKLGLQGVTKEEVMDMCKHLDNVCD